MKLFYAIRIPCNNLFFDKNDYFCTISKRPPDKAGLVCPPAFTLFVNSNSSFQKI